jgi:hypothetical protein
MRLSVSQIGTFANCPEQWRRRYIEGEKIPPGIAAHVGQGVHKGAEVNWRAKIQTGQDEPLDVVLDAARDGYVHAMQGGVYVPPEGKSSFKKDAAESLDRVIKMARVFREKFAPAIRPKFVEKRIEFTDPRTPHLSWLGFLDLVTEDGRLSDLKTSARAWSQSRADSSIQASAYWRFLQEVEGKPPEKITFDVISCGKGAAKLTSLETSRTAHDWDALLLRADAMIRMVEAGIFPPAEPGSWLCGPKWCGYYWTCPYIPAHKKNRR